MILSNTFHLPYLLFIRKKKFWKWIIQSWYVLDPIPYSVWLQLLDNWHQCITRCTFMMIHFSVVKLWTELCWPRSSLAIKKLYWMYIDSSAVIWYVWFAWLAEFLSFNQFVCNFSINQSQCAFLNGMWCKSHENCLPIGQMKHSERMCSRK